MDGMRRKRRHADGNVLRGFIGSRILDPLSWVRHYGLPGRNIEASFPVAHVQLSSNHDRVLLKLRRLSRLLPSGGAAHMRDTYRLVFRVHPAKEFINDLWHVARGLYPSGTFNVCRQNLSPASLCEMALAKRACRKVTYRVF